MSHKTFIAVGIACMVAMSAAYLIYLAASWEAGKRAREVFDARVNELLDRIPHDKPSPAE